VFVTSDSGLEGGSTGDVGADSSVNPIAFNISSFGEVAISLSSGVMVDPGASFGTARNIVPPWLFVSGTLPIIDHLLLFALPTELDPLVEKGIVSPMLVVGKASACTVGTGVSVPFRLKIDILRLAILFELGS
jgi:hypothetical protein